MKPRLSIRKTKREKLPRTMVYQKKFLDDESDNILVEKGRQEGFSEYASLKAVRSCIKDDAKYNWWVCSKDETAAKEFLRDCQKWCNIYKYASSKIGLEIIEKENVYTIEFASGVKIHVLSSNADVIAGKRGNLILDEFALHKEQQKLLKVSSAVTQWGDQRIVITTHRSKQSVFYALVNDIVNNGNPMEWSHHKVTIEDACDAGIVERINAKTGKNMTREDFLKSCRAKCFTEADYLEEYMCIAQDSAGQLIDWDVINKQTNNSLASETCDVSTLSKLCMGNDVARISDLHCYIGLSPLPGGEAWAVKIVDIQDREDKTWGSRDARLDHWARMPQVRIIDIDQTGIGDKYVEDGIKRNGFKIRGIKFTNTSKDALAMPLFEAMRAGKIFIPNHGLLKMHIASITKGKTATGLPSYDADHNADGHADLFWALALAWHSATSKVAAGVFDEDNIKDVVMADIQASGRSVFTPRTLS
ncbi:MAG: terminase family protein [Akkermansia sp.]